MSGNIFKESFFGDPTAPISLPPSIPISASIFKAVDSGGTELTDQSGDGIVVKDGGNVGILSNDPSTILEVKTRQTSETNIMNVINDDEESIFKLTQDTSDGNLPVLELTNPTDGDGWTFTGKKLEFIYDSGSGSETKLLFNILEETNFIKGLSDGSEISLFDLISDAGNELVRLMNNQGSGKVRIGSAAAVRTIIMDTDTKAKMVIGGFTPSPNADLLLEGGVMMIKETTTPSADTDYAKVYAKADNKLYFQDGAGVEHEVSLAT